MTSVDVLPRGTPFNVIPREVLPLIYFATNFGSFDCQWVTFHGLKNKRASYCVIIHHRHRTVQNWRLYINTGPLAERILVEISLAHEAKSQHMQNSRLLKFGFA